MFKKLFVLIQYLLPQHPLSRLMGKLTRCTHPVFKDWFIRTFIQLYRVDMDQALEPAPRAYPCFNDFFTRALRPEARPIPVDPAAVLCPADGFVSQIGRIADGRIVQAKGRDYSVMELLGGDPERAEPFFDGHFATIYLSPRDYHRVHMPVGGILQSMTLIPGRLFSVNGTTAAAVPNLFARNERVAALFDTAVGPMAVVLVGAIFVASIETVWHGVVTPPSGGTPHTWRYLQNPASLARSDELGRFNMGSTVIVLFAEDAVEWKNTLAAEQIVRMGEELGRVSARRTS